MNEEFHCTLLSIPILNDAWGISYQKSVTGAVLIVMALIQFQE